MSIDHHADACASKRPCGLQGVVTPSWSRVARAHAPSCTPRRHCKRGHTHHTYGYASDMHAGARPPPRRPPCAVGSCGLPPPLATWRLPASPGSPGARAPQRCDQETVRLRARALLDWAREYSAFYLAARRASSLYILYLNFNRGAPYFTPRTTHTGIFQGLRHTPTHRADPNPARSTEHTAPTHIRDTLTPNYQNATPR